MIYNELCYIDVQLINKDVLKVKIFLFVKDKIDCGKKQLIRFLDDDLNMIGYGFLDICLNWKIRRIKF